MKKALFEKFNVELNPKYLIADAARSIQNAFKMTFADSEILMCWFHMRKALSKQLEKHIHDKIKRQRFLADLDKLQLSQSPEIFDTASKLFIVKWQPESKDLLEYFCIEWLNQNRNWYEGVAKMVPSTNNALESNNRLLKDEQTLRERMDLAQFRFQICDTIRQWSLEYDSGLNKINKIPHIDLQQWTAGYNWAKSNCVLRMEIAEHYNIYRPGSTGKCN